MICAIAKCRKYEVEKIKIHSTLASSNVEHNVGFDYKFIPSFVVLIKCLLFLGKVGEYLNEPQI